MRDEAGGGNATIAAGNAHQDLLQARKNTWDNRSDTFPLPCKALPCLGQIQTSAAKKICQNWAEILVSSQMAENTCKSTRQCQVCIPSDKTVQDAEEIKMEYFSLGGAVL